MESRTFSLGMKEGVSCLLSPKSSIISSSVLEVPFIGDKGSGDTDSGYPMTLLFDPRGDSLSNISWDKLVVSVLIDSG